MTVQIYHWLTARVLGRYSAGDIIVAAESVDEARETVRTSFAKFIDEHSVEFHVDEYVYDEEEIAENRKKAFDALERDLLEAPQVGHVVFVWGSE